VKRKRGRRLGKYLTRANTDLYNKTKKKKTEVSQPNGGQAVNTRVVRDDWVNPIVTHRVRVKG